MIVNVLRRMIFEAFASAGKKGMTYNELVKELGKEPIYSALLTSDEIKDRIVTQVSLGRLSGSLSKIDTERFFITKKGLRELQDSCKVR
jgi:hypothetical protein